jgi:hypothetical protein
MAPASKTVRICGLFDPQNCTVVFVDDRPPAPFGVSVTERPLLVNDTIAFAKAAKAFNVPVILTAAEIASASDPT